MLKTSLVLLWISSVFSISKIDCILKNIFRNVVINDDLKRNFQEFFDEIDFNQKYNVDDMEPV